MSQSRCCKTCRWWSLRRDEWGDCANGAGHSHARVPMGDGSFVMIDTFGCHETKAAHVCSEWDGGSAHIHDAGLYTRAEAETIQRDHAPSRKLTLYPRPTGDVQIVEIVKRCMELAWTDICADSGYRPRDLERRGSKTFFTPSTWATLTGEMVSVELRKRGIYPENEEAANPAREQADG